MNLTQKSDNPARRLTWQGKTLTTCSRQELIQYIIRFNQQMALSNQSLERAQQQIKAQAEIIKGLSEKQEPAVPEEREENANQ